MKLFRKRRVTMREVLGVTTAKRRVLKSLRGGYKKKDIDAVTNCFTCGGCFGLAVFIILISIPISYFVS